MDYSRLSPGLDAGHSPVSLVQCQADGGGLTESSLSLQFNKQQKEKKKRPQRRCSAVIYCGFSCGTKQLKDVRKKLRISI